MYVCMWQVGWITVPRINFKINFDGILDFFELLILKINFYEILEFFEFSIEFHKILV